MHSSRPRLFTFFFNNCRGRNTVIKLVMIISQINGGDPLVLQLILILNYFSFEISFIGVGTELTCAAKISNKHES